LGISWRHESHRGSSTSLMGCNRSNFNFFLSVWSISRRGIFIYRWKTSILIADALTETRMESETRLQPVCSVVTPYRLGDTYKRFRVICCLDIQDICSVINNLWPSLWCRFRGPEFNSRRYQIFKEIVGLERGPLSLVRITEELLEWKTIGSGSRKPKLAGVGIRCADHATPSIRETWH
jgi:hypothetical protein